MIKDYFVHIHKRQIKAEHTLLIPVGFLGFLVCLRVCFFASNGLTL